MTSLGLDWADGRNWHLLVLQRHEIGFVEILAESDFSSGWSQHGAAAMSWLRSGED